MFKFCIVSIFVTFSTLAMASIEGKDCSLQGERNLEGKNWYTCERVCYDADQGQQDCFLEWKLLYTITPEDENQQ